MSADTAKLPTLKAHKRRVSKSMTSLTQLINNSDVNTSVISLDDHGIGELRDRLAATEPHAPLGKRLGTASHGRSSKEKDSSKGLASSDSGKPMII